LKGSYEKPLNRRWDVFRDWLKKLNFYKNAYRCFDKIIVFTEEEKKAVRALSPRADISVVPIGVEIESYKFKSNSDSPLDLIFVGYMGHYPNVDGITYFCNKIFPMVQKKLPLVNLHIIGSKMNGELSSVSGNKNIQIIGEVEDIRPYLAKAKVFVAPLRLGRGLRVKILEAMAMGLPVVATSVACSGIRAAAGKSILIADRPHKFSADIIRLAQDEGLRNDIAANARNIVERYYSCKNTQRQLQEIYGEMIGDAR
jgi:glycosyltransferase involved in cell wall biosynthesis